MARDSTETRRRILEAAYREFARHGLAGARVDRIAAAAQANKRAIYDYFGNKQQLFDVVVVDGGDRYLCAESAAQVVASDGLIVVDDSEGFWGEEGTYPIIDLLHGLGFGRVDYYGFRPCGWHLGCTSLFFRAGTKVFQHLPPPRREREVFGFRNRVSV